MPEKNLTSRELEDIFLEAVRIALEIPDDNSTVRLAYGAGSPTGSSPMHDIHKSVCYVSITTTDDGYAKSHHISYESVEGSDKLTEVDEYTEEYAVAYSCYGDGSLEMARKVRDGFYSASVKDYLNGYDIRFAPTNPQIITAREILETQWVQRNDFTATFYVGYRVERAEAVGRIDEVHINLSP